MLDVPVAGSSVVDLAVVSGSGSGMISFRATPKNEVESRPILSIFPAVSSPFRISEQE